MNPIAEEILSCFGISDSDFLEHYGMPRRSGRYPWGSGEDPYQHNKDFLGRIEELRKQNFTYTDEKTGKTYSGDTAIAKSLGMTSTQFRAEIGIARSERRALQVAKAKSLREDGLSTSQIGREMGVNESTVRSWFDAESEARMTQARRTADELKSLVDEHGMIDVGTSADLELRVSKERLKQALYLLEKDGYKVWTGGIPQVTNQGQQTVQRVLCVPGTPHKAIYEYDKVHSIRDYISRDGGETLEKKFTYPASLDSKRMMVRYNEEGGLERDGTVELRRNVPDLSLGESRYSQVRIMVDGTHYIKGMAVYSDDMPPGVDVIFNTNKKKGTPLGDVLKEIKNDPDNPFGSAIKDAELGGQYWYNDPKTGERKLGLINKRADEGDWSDWKDALPAQFLSKQALPLAKQQLGIAKQDKLDEFDSYCELTNPTIKKHLLDKFADTCESAAEHLQAAALPGQKYNVIIPINSLKDTEVYAPGFKDGTKLALIRYPHGGTFEIPILTVNNRNEIANKLLGPDVKDAVGITSKVAERLSGADFDGDTVMCIPTDDPAGRVHITSTPKLKGLEGFDPKVQYGPETYAGREVKLMTKKGMQTQMGVISNLITDMTLARASDDELAAAVRHSMVVIDSYKHKLDYKQSELDNNIAALHKTYQGKATGGAATIISRAKGQASVLKRQGSPYVNIEGKEGYDPTRPEGSLIYKVAEDKNLYRPVRTVNKKTGIHTLTTSTGEKIKYDPTNADDREMYTPIKNVDKKTGKVTYTNKAGTITYAMEARTQKSTKMAETDDAYTLVSKAKHPMEMVYAEYANSMKALARRARMESATTGSIVFSKSAAETYKAEVEELKRKLTIAQLNTGRERAAQRMANAEVQRKLKEGLIEKEEMKKAGQKAITKYRAEVGSVSRKDRNIDITDREWEAIQAGAVSESTLKKILNNTDVDALRQRATPRATATVNNAKAARINNMRASGYTLAQIADACGVSVSTVSDYLKGAN